MTSTKKTYKLSKIKQLIDLNGDSTNFDIQFKVTSTDNAPFDIIVVDQTTLDNSPELEYKKVNGQISGSMVQDKNVYQNHFIVLKADNPCQCDVEIIKKELPKTKTAEEYPEQNGIPQIPDTSQQPMRVHQSLQSQTNWKMWAIVAVLVVGAVVLYMVWSSDKKKGGVTDAPAMSTNPLNPFASSPVASSPVASSRASPSPKSSYGGGGNSLMDRLKRLHMN